LFVTWVKNRSFFVQLKGALICFEKKYKKLLGQASDNIAGAKRRVFWQSLTQISYFAENELQTNKALSIVLESFPDEEKAVNGRSWLRGCLYILR